MMKLTIQLFLKALLIGLAVNLCLLYAAQTPSRADKRVNSQPTYQKLEQSSTAPAWLKGFGN